MRYKEMYTIFCTFCVSGPELLRRAVQMRVTDGRPCLKVANVEAALWSVESGVEWSGMWSGDWCERQEGDA